MPTLSLSKPACDRTYLQRPPRNRSNRYHTSNSMASIPQIDRPGVTQRPWQDRLDMTYREARPDAVYQAELQPAHDQPVLAAAHADPDNPRPHPGLPQKTEQTHIPLQGLSIWHSEPGQHLMNVECPARPQLGVPLRAFRCPAPTGPDPSATQLRDLFDDRHSNAMAQLVALARTRHDHVQFIGMLNTVVVRFQNMYGAIQTR